MCVVMVAAGLAGCGSSGIGLGGTLIAPRPDCVLVAENGRGDGTPFRPPPGWQVTYDPPGVLDPDGRLVAQEGDVIHSGGRSREEDSAGSSCDRGRSDVLLMREAIRVED